MAGKLGEVFVEILGDAAPFADDFASALGDAGTLAEEELTGALADAAESAGAELVEGMDEAGGEMVSAIGEAGAAVGDELVEGMGEAGSGVVDTLGAAGEEAGGELAAGLEAAVDAIDLDVDASGAFDGITADAESAAADAADALEGELASIDVDVDAGGAFDGIAAEAASAAADAADEFAGLGDTIAAEIESGVDSASGALGSLTDSLGSVQGALGTLAGGAGLEGFARAQAPLTEQTAQLAHTLGMTEGEMRNLARESANVTNPLEQTLNLMEQGRGQGLDSAEALQEFVRVWDTVGDATGANAEQLARSSAALRALGIDADEPQEAMAALGYIHRDTAGDVQGFMDAVGRLAPEMSEMGLTIDDAAAVMGALEQEMGLTSRVARQEFRRAVNDSDGDLASMLDTLGLSTDALAEYQDRVAGAADVIDDYADIHAESYTPIQRLQHGISELAYRFSGVAEGAALLAAPLSALGPAMLGLNQGAQLLQTGLGGRLVGALRGAATGFRTLATAILTNPIFLIAGVIIGIVAVVWHFRDEIIAALGAAWDWIRDVFGNLVDWFSDVWNRVVEVVPEAFRSMMDWLRGLPGRIIEAIQGLASTVWNFIVEHHPLAQLWRLVADNWTAISTWFTELPGRIVETLGGLATTVLDFIREWHPLAIAWRLVQEFGPQVLDGIVSLVTSVAETVAGWVETIVGFVTDLWQRWVNLVHGIRDAVVEAVVTLAANVVETVSGWVANVVGFVTDLWDRWTSLVRDIRDAVIGFIADLVENVISTISGWVSDVLGFVTGLREDFTGTISDLVSDVLGFFRDLPGNILSALGDLSTLLLDVGKDIVQGLINGVSGMASAAGGALRDVASGMVSNVKGFFGISSPSRLFADEIGGPLMEGVALGVERLAPSAIDEIERFANEATSAGQMGAIFNEEELRPVGGRPATSMRPADADPVGVGAAARGRGGEPQVVQNIYTVDPVKAGMQAVRELRDLTYLSAPFSAPRVGDGIDERRDPRRGS